MSKKKEAQFDTVTDEKKLAAEKKNVSCIPKSLVQELFIDNSNDFSIIHKKLKNETEALSSSDFKLKMSLELIKRAWDARLERDGKFLDWLKQYFPECSIAYWGFSGVISMLVELLHKNGIYTEPHSFFSICKNNELYKTLKETYEKIGIERLNMITKLERNLKVPVLEDILSNKPGISPDHIEYIAHNYSYKTVPIIVKHGSHFINWEAIRHKVDAKGSNFNMGTKAPESNIDKVFLPTQINKLVAQLRETILNDRLDLNIDGNTVYLDGHIILKLQETKTNGHFGELTSKYNKLLVEVLSEIIKNIS